MDTSQHDAGCDRDNVETTPLPGTTPAPPPTPYTGMTACRAAALIQKRIA